MTRIGGRPDRGEMTRSLGALIEPLHPHGEVSGFSQEHGCSYLCDAVNVPNPRAGEDNGPSSDSRR